MVEPKRASRAGEGRAEQIERDVRELAARGRAFGSSGHARARAYLVDRFTEIGIQTYRGAFVHEYAAGFANVLGVLPGSAARDFGPVVLGAHYDTCGDLPGADDNATGVAALLHLAQALRTTAHQRDIVIAAFDAEEPPHFLTPLMGSNAFFEQQGGDAAECAVIFDIVGHDFPLPLRKRTIIITGAESHPNLAEALAAIGQPEGLHVLAAHSRYVTQSDELDLSDYHVFRKHGTPFLFLSAGHWAHYHERTDTPDRLDFAKVHAVAEYVLRVVGEIDGRSLGRFSHVAVAGDDTLALEVKTIREVLGPLGALPLRRIRTRRDLDGVAEFLRRTLRV